jgi:hypothetical protein
MAMLVLFISMSCILWSDVLVNTKVLSKVNNQGEVGDDHPTMEMMEKMDWREEARRQRYTFGVFAFADQGTIECTVEFRIDSYTIKTGNLKRLQLS